MAATLAQVSTLLITVGLPQRPADRGIGRPGVGFADIAFHGGDEGGFFAADESPGALADLDVEGEAGPQDIGSQEARFPGLVDGQGQALHRQGIFMAHVDVALVGADGVSPDDHAFQDGVGVALHDGPVHEGPGVAFVPVADQVFDVPGHLPAEAPFAPGGKTAAAPAPEARALHRVDDGLGAHAAKDLLEGLIAARRQVIVQAGGVDEVHFAQDDGMLPLVERHFGLMGLDGPVSRDPGSRTYPESCP